jgi:hypothetical protein
MARSLFISEKYIKDHTGLNFNLESKIIMNCVNDEQDSKMDSSLGKTLYDKLQDMVYEFDHSGTTIPPLYYRLLTEYVQSALKFYVVADLIAENHIKISNTGSQIMESENAKPAPFKDVVTWQIQFYLNKAQERNQKLINFLKENINNIPEYLSPGTGWDITQPKRSENMFNGMYIPGHSSYSKKWGYLD